MVRKKNIFIMVIAMCIMLASMLLHYTPYSLAKEVPANLKIPEEIINISEEVGEEFNICPELLQSLMFYESTFRPRAVNGHCKGIAQIDERFHRDRMDKLGVTDLFDPYQNLRVAADYLMELAEKYHCIGIVLMRYNGFRDPEGYVQRTGKLSDYAEKVLELSAALERQNGK